MKRRDFLKGLGGALSIPLPAYALNQEMSKEKLEINYRVKTKNCELDHIGVGAYKQGDVLYVTVTPNTGDPYGADDVYLIINNQRVEGFPQAGAWEFELTEKEVKNIVKSEQIGVLIVG